MQSKESIKIKINGKSKKTFCRTAFEVKECDYEKDSIVIINGFQIQEDCELKEGDELFVIKKGSMPAKDELEAMMAARHTPKVHEAVKKGKVAVAGLGGLGSNIAVSLARVGVGQLLLVDFDIVEPSNLNRQHYQMKHLGVMKTAALQQQIEEINPFIRVEVKNVKVESKNIETLFKDYEIICEAFDNPVYKAMLVNTILEKMPDKKIVAASGMAGFTSSNSIQTSRKMKHLYVCGDMENEAKVGNGLMAPRVQICAGHQANMILRLLLGEIEP